MAITYSYSLVYKCYCDDDKENECVEVDNEDMNLDDMFFSVVEHRIYNDLMDNDKPVVWVRKFCDCDHTITDLVGYVSNDKLAFDSDV